jgi:hypothetical protein
MKDIFWIFSLALISASQVGTASLAEQSAAAQQSSTYVKGRRE